MPPGSILLFLTIRHKGWTIHIHGPHVAGGKRHAHISKPKLGGEYSWNDDGTRHDEHRFPKNEKWIKKARKIAAGHLGVAPDRLLLIVEEPGSCVGFFSETEELSDESLPGDLFSLCCPANAILIVFVVDDAPGIHAAIIQIEDRQQIDSRDA